MAWFKIDDGFWSHPKVIALSAEAGWLWTRAGTYSMQHLTDGVIRPPVLRMLGTDDSAAELVDAGLWLVSGDDFTFHDWGEYQPTKEEVEKDRAAGAERKRQSRLRRQSQQESQVESHRGGHVTGGVTDGRSHSDPTRPDPTRPTTSNEVVKDPPIGEHFESAWKHWPKKDDKKDALAKWPRAVAEFGHGEFQLASIVALHGDAYKAHRTKQFTPALVVWLNKARWDNEPPAAEEPKRPNTDWALRPTKADQNAAEYQRIYGGGNERAGSVPAIDAG